MFGGWVAGSNFNLGVPSKGKFSQNPLKRYILRGIFIIRGTLQ